MKDYCVKIQSLSRSLWPQPPFVLPANRLLPRGLLVNGVSNPLAIDRDATRFTWRSADGDRGRKANRVSDTGFFKRRTVGRLATGDWWDSGKVDSDKSASVEYAGKPLPPAARFWWKVRIWDQTGKASHYSAPNYFDTGLNQNEWTAHYIWDGTTNANNFAYFRKTFVVTNKPELAKVYVTAHNDYLLYFNGQLLGRGPARCDPYHYGQYNAYDVTKLLKTGTNVFAAMGHWREYWNNAGIDAQPAFLLEARPGLSGWLVFERLEPMNPGRFWPTPPLSKPSQRTSTATRGTRDHSI